ncbi:hypothetical protein [Lactiplantibacillus plantarum]|uniref:hypothetical protein n=1 Tax=Lactiplantibacillus plantarum TaxID=1590 RepID=UPI002869161D|nr:hypothetical protein [Lactiplantibacillus plantarum]WMX73198.1 hypothetical protein RF670_14320 [Lactiplantibacillus plantarum]
MNDQWRSTNDFYDQVKINLRSECNVILAENSQSIPLTARISIVRGSLDKYATVKFWDDGDKNYKIQCYMAYNAIKNAKILLSSILKEMDKTQIYNRYSLCEDITEYYRDIDISEGLHSYWNAMRDDKEGPHKKEIIENIVDYLYDYPNRNLNYPFKIASKNKISNITKLQDQYLSEVYENKIDAAGVYGLLADGTHSIRPISVYGYDLGILSDTLRDVSQKMLDNIG